MAKKRFGNTRLSLFPKSVVIVTSINNAGVIGGTTISWNGILSSRPPIIGVSFLPDSFTRTCILESRDFVVNVPDGRLWKETNYLGSLTGPWDLKTQKAPEGMSKLTLATSTTVRAPRIEECYLAFECRMLRVVQIGLYDCFFGEVLTMYCDESVFLDNHPKGDIDHNMLQPILCLGDQYWSGGAFLGTSTENKNHPHGSEH